MITGSVPDAPLIEALNENRPIVFKVHNDGKDFLVSTFGSYNPKGLIESFCLETEVRKDWWLVQPGDVVLDVGAGYGSYVAAAVASGASVVIAWEPGRGEYFDLGTLIMINGWFNQVIALPALAGIDVEGWADFFPFSHSAQRPQGHSENRTSISVDFAVERFALKPQWLKVDVEGGELNVLKGAEKTLSDNDVRVIVECHVGFTPGIDGEVAAFMEGVGYALEGIKRGDGINDLWQLWGKANHMQEWEFPK